MRIAESRLEPRRKVPAPAWPAKQPGRG